MLDSLGRTWFHLRYRPQIYLEAIWQQVAPKRQLTPHYKKSPCIRPQWIWRPVLSRVLEVVASHLVLRSAILRFSASAQFAQPTQVAGYRNVQRVLRYPFWFTVFNLLAPDFFFLILAHPVYKMWIIQEPNTLELWNKLHFEEEKNWEYIPCLNYSVPIFVE